MVVLAQALVSQPRSCSSTSSRSASPRSSSSGSCRRSQSVATSGVGVLLIEQFAHVALGLAETAYVLERGRIHYHGTAQRLRTSPSCSSPPTCCARSTPAATRSRPSRRRGGRCGNAGDGADRPRAGRRGRARAHAPARARPHPPAGGAPELRPRLGRELLGRGVRVRDAIEKLRAVRAAGHRTLVDPTAPGLGRCIPRIQRINAEVDLNIVVASGVYAFVELPNFLHYRSAEAIAELFVRELREGIDDTGVRAAFIKCAVEEHGPVGDIPGFSTRWRSLRSRQALR